MGICINSSQNIYVEIGTEATFTFTCRSYFGNICFKFSVLCFCSAYPLKEGDIRGALIVEELAVGPREAGFHGLPVLRAQTTEVLAENGKKIQNHVLSVCKDWKI